MRQSVPQRRNATHAARPRPSADTGRAAGVLTPDEWAAQLSGTPDFSSDGLSWDAALIRHWTGTSPVMEQPPLDHHYVVQHLGGAKLVERRCDGPPVSTAIDTSALTIVPAGTQFTWRTRGPIEFAHLYISPALLARSAARFDKAHEISLIDRVGIADPLLSALFGGMLQEVRAPSTHDLLYLDSLLEVFMLRLLLMHGNRRLRGATAREKLSASQHKRVVEFIEARLDTHLRLSDLAGICGASAFHFCRAFKNSAGVSPYQYVVNRRIERAKHLLETSDLTLAEIARDCGFRGVTSFRRTFTRVLGDTPNRFRRSRIGERAMRRGTPS